MYTLLENTLPESYVNQILHELENNTSWKFIASSSDVGYNFDPNDKNIKDSSQFVHAVAQLDEPMSPMFYLIRPLLWFVEKETGLKISSIIRIKVNCLTRDGTDPTKYNPPHVDVYEPGSMSMIYYAHDCDGDTVMFEQYSKDGHNNLTEVARITPKKGNILIFHADRFHASSCPINYGRRLIINFILKVEE